MQHYAFPDRFRTVYAQAVALYRAGHRGPRGLVPADDERWLAANGISVQNLYDYAEDDVGEGAPGFDRALGIESVRRDYFLNIQGGRPSGKVIDEASLPPKQAAIRGISWLPRLLPKARAKLRGELPASLMYCCGGDRHFFQTHDVLPAEFLSVVWRSGDRDEAVVDWLVARSPQARASAG